MLVCIARHFRDVQTFSIRAASFAAASTAPPVPILSRGENFTVVAKPGGVPCHASDYVGRRRTRKGVNDEDVDEEGEPPVPLLQRVRDTLGARVNLVHRLDRGASGCVLCAWSDHETATHLLHEALTSEGAQKTYVAICRGEGVLKGEDLREKGWFTIDRPIRDERGRVNDATTDFLFVAGQPSPPADEEKDNFDSRCCVVLARPRTGRWHQIRRHLNGLSHPILGDSTHGNSRTNRSWRRHGGLPGERMCLHLAHMRLPPTDVTRAASTAVVEECDEDKKGDGDGGGGGGYGVDARCPLPEDMLHLLRTNAPGVLAASKAALEREAGLLVVLP